MDFLQGFFYLMVGLAATLFIADRLTQVIKTIKSQREKKLTEAFNKRMDIILENIVPTVELWWEDHGRMEVGSCIPDALMDVPEPVRDLFEQQHAQSVKQAAGLLAAMLVADAEKVDMSSVERRGMEIRIKETRGHLMHHGINLDEFESLFV